MLIGGVAAAAAEQVIPLGRVWSFPSKIVIPQIAPLPSDDWQTGSVYLVNAAYPLGQVVYYDKAALEILKRNFVLRYRLEPNEEGSGQIGE